MAAEQKNDLLNRVGQNLNIDRAALEEKADELLEKVVEKKKVGMFRGIQTRVMTAMMLTALVCVTLVMMMAVEQSKASLKKRVLSDMQTMVDAYGVNLETAAYAMGNEVPKSEGLQSMYGGVKLDGMSSSYIYVTDADGIMLMHPTESKVGQSVKNDLVTGIVRQLQQGVIPESGVMEYKDEGTEKLAGYYVMRNGKAILVLSADRDDAFEAVSDFVFRCSMVSVIILVLIAVAGALISRSIAKPIKMLTGVVDQNAEFDFTENRASRLLSKGKGETAVMSVSLEVMRANLVNMVNKLIATGTKLSENANGLKEIVEKLNSNSCDNSATSQQLAASMEETSATTQLIDERMSNINENARKIGSLTKEGEENAEGIITKAEKLKANTQEANNKTREIYSKVKQESDIAIEKAKDIEQINALTEAITSIASQTELLSLNASIEAARAGEAGRGFAVVAGEIGSLASQSTETANNITSIVAGVKNAAESMETCLRQMISFMEETVIADYENFIRVSEEYSSDAKDFSGSMQNINSSIAELEESIADITKSIQDINSTVNEATVSINEVANKATDMVGYANDTGDKAEENTKCAIQLEEIVRKFKI
ncbi:MAG: methyl-accepting chemotaxis protein [Butyrivibrio sp.]|nr:methyl-accepting chemotaxis protein [Acetatifactor muris]MCM1558609.1 methyl-accepting chemotaxis protein [Butyrivibrio sp.]